MRDKITVHVECQIGPERLSSAIVIDDPICEEFEPLNLCSEPSFIAGEVVLNSNSHRRAMEARQRRAQRIAQALTSKLVEAMGRNDTLNGYSKKQTGGW